MSTRKRTLLYSGLACTVLALAPTTAAAATTSAPAPRVATDAPPGYIVKTTANISLPNNDGTFGEAHCPKHTVVLSGGAYIASSSVKTGINASFPLNRRTWEAVANNFSGAATTFNVYAVCAKHPNGYQQLTGSAVSNPAGDQDSATENCPTGDLVLAGGTIGDDPSFSVGMASSYPGTSASWTAAVSNFSTRNSQFNVVAVCAAASAFPHYAIPSTSASDPARRAEGHHSKVRRPGGGPRRRQPVVEHHQPPDRNQGHPAVPSQRNQLEVRREQRHQRWYHADLLRHLRHLTHAPARARRANSDGGRREVAARPPPWHGGREDHAVQQRRPQPRNRAARPLPD